MDLLICMGDTLTLILSKILSFTNFMIIPMMNINSSQLSVFFAMKIPFRLTITIFSYMDLFKYYNVKSNLKTVTAIKSEPNLVCYLMTSSNINLWTTPSIPVYQRVPLSKIITNHLFLQWMCILVENLLQLILSIVTHLPLIMVLYKTSYLLAQSHWFPMYMVWKTDEKFVNTLEDNIRARGATSKLISDLAQPEVRNRIQSIIWALFIDDLEKWTTLSAPERWCALL